MHLVDTSALVKLVVPEPESGALRAWIVGDSPDVGASSLVRVELIRAVRRSDADPDAPTRARDLLARLTLIEMSAEVLDAASELRPSSVRSLDAIHLATAFALGDDLEAIITYDERMADAARGLGLPVLAPG